MKNLRTIILVLLSMLACGSVQASTAETVKSALVYAPFGPNLFPAEAYREEWRSHFQFPETQPERRMRPAAQVQAGQAIVARVRERLNATRIDGYIPRAGNRGGMLILNGEIVEEGQAIWSDSEETVTLFQVRDNSYQVRIIVPTGETVSTSIDLKVWEN